MAWTPRFGVPEDLEFPGLPTVEDWNLLKNALEHNAGGHVYDLHGVGCYSGWVPTSAKQVTAGSGVVGTAGLAAFTDAAKDVTGLQDDAVNYVFAVPNADTVQTGDVDFVGYYAEEYLDGAVLVGTLTLDGAGDVTHVNGVAVGDPYEDLWERDVLYRRRISRVHGSGISDSIEPGGATSIEIDHSYDASFLIPGSISVTLDNENFSWAVYEGHYPDRFVLLLFNDGGYAASVGYSWIRYGETGA